MFHDVITTIGYIVFVLFCFVFLLFTSGCIIDSIHPEAILVLKHSLGDWAQVQLT